VAGTTTVADRGHRRSVEVDIVATRDGIAIEPADVYG
jgi:hypothetical protein